MISSDERQLVPRSLGLTLRCQEWKCTTMQKEFDDGE
jgi:hypothetical protein